MKNKQNINIFSKRILRILVIFGILTPGSIVLAATTTITNNTSGTITNSTCIDRTFSMPSSAKITDITITVDIDHPRRRDLDINLISPQGTSVDLSSDNGGTSDNLKVFFSDAAATSIVGDLTNHTTVVTRRPEAVLSAFDGENPSGTWTLHSCNDNINGAGTFNYAILDINDTPPPPIESGLSVNFQMDECYWLGGANGVLDDVKDSSSNMLDAQSRNRADNTGADFKICRGGDFNNTYSDTSLSDAVFYPSNTVAQVDVGKNTPFTVSAWVYRHAGGDKWMAAVIKVSDDSWTDGWGLEHASGSGANIDFFVNNYGIRARAALTVDTWTHVVGTYDGANIRLYTNGVLRNTTAQTTYIPATLAVAIGDDISGSAIDDRWQGNIDEVKIWNRALSASEITNIYNNENAGLNYNGTTRACKSCNGSSIVGQTWELIGIPSDGRTTSLTVDDVFGDDMNGTPGSDWKIFKRIYSTVDNSSNYLELGLTDSLEFGQGYWLGSRLSSEWDVDGTSVVDYNSTNPACPAAQCVEIPLIPVTKNFTAPDFDANDGSGNYRNNMTGFIGIDKPVEWADCRLVFDDNGTAYTPSDANTSGLASKQIWLYNPSAGGADSNGYITCDDVTPGGCKLIPFKGFWIQLTGKSKGHSVKLLIPKE